MSISLRRTSWNGKAELRPTKKQTNQEWMRPENGRGGKWAELMERRESCGVSGPWRNSTLTELICIAQHCAPLVLPISCLLYILFLLWYFLTCWFSVTQCYIHTSAHWAQRLLFGTIRPQPKLELWCSCLRIIILFYSITSLQWVHWDMCKHAQFTVGRAILTYHDWHFERPKSIL